MNIEKTREEFEAAYMRGMVGSSAEPASVWLERGSEGEYRSYQARGAWWGWQAFRESLVIELPPVWEESPNTALGQACAQIRTADIAAIEAAGLKVKS